MTKPAWTEDKIQLLRLMASEDIPVAVIGAELGFSRKAVWRCCVREGIKAIRFTPEEERIRAANRRVSEDKRNKRRSSRRSAQRAATRAAKIPKAETSATVSYTSPGYRLQNYQRSGNDEITTARRTRAGRPQHSSDAGGVGRAKFCPFWQGSDAREQKVT